MKVYYDFHLHSCLSPCGDDDMTPNNIVNMSMLNELNLIALSDHNTAGNTSAFMKVAQNAGIAALAGMELETAEEIHVLCLFRSAESAERFDREVVAPALPPIKNRIDIFGHQQRMDEQDEIIAEDERYLINATAITIDALPQLIAPYGGIAIPAHIDKPTKSILSVLGYIDPSWGYTLLELSKNAPETFVEDHPELAGCRFLHDSDAHYLQDINEAGNSNFLEVNNPDIDEIWQLLIAK